MKPALIDTNILSLFFRGQAQVVANFASYLAEHPSITFSTINYYEIISGLKHRDAHKQLDVFLAIIVTNGSYPNNGFLMTKSPTRKPFCISSE